MRKKINQLFNLENDSIIVVCEISGNHKNSFNHMKSFLNSAIKQRVDFIKFQVYRPDTLTLNSKKKDFKLNDNINWKKYKNLYDLFSKSHTPWNWIEKSIKILNKNKIKWFASPFDYTSVDFLEKLNCQIYKIASPEITDVNLIEYVAQKKKPIIISTGMADMNDLCQAIKIIKKYHNNIAILKCTSDYPAKNDDLNLSVIPKLKKKFRYPIGFSDHTIGSLASIVSVTQGATLIEKHFKLDNDNSSVDNHFSEKISNYQNFKLTLEEVRKSLGKKSSILKVAKEKKKQRRSIYVSADIKKMK